MGVGDINRWEKNEGGEEERMYEGVEVTGALCLGSVLIFDSESGRK